MSKQKPAGRLRATIVVEWEVGDLASYGVATLAEAAKIDQAAYDEGDICVEDLLAFSFGDAVSCKIEAVKGEQEL